MTLIVSKNPTETNEILWMKSNEEILNLWNFSKNSIKNMSRINQVGAIYLDKSKKFHFSNSFEKLDDLNNNRYTMIQKYIPNPLVIKNRVFKISLPIIIARSALHLFASLI